MNTDRPTRNPASPHQVTWLFAAIMLVMVGALLVWIKQTRFQEYMAYQQRIMQGSVNGTAEEIGIFIKELRRSVHLFAASQKDLIEKLAAHPDDTQLRDQLAKIVQESFPESFTFTIADKNGTPLLVDFDGLLGDICIQDIRQFSTDRQHSEVYIHPRASAYHFDVMVDREQYGKVVGIFFISVSTDALSKILKHGEAPDHKLMLLHRHNPGLIEVTAEGARVNLKRDFKLKPDEMRTIGYAKPIPGTAWDLVDIPSSNLFGDADAQLQRGMLLIMLAFISVSAVMLALLYRTQAKSDRLHFLYTHDPLTGLPNRFFLIEQLQKSISKAQRDNAEFSLLFIEFGELRIPNTTFFDRPDTNELLRSAANRIKALLSPSDTLARLGGYEFAVLLAAASEEQAAKIAETIHATFSQPPTGLDATSQRISLGFAVYPKHGKDFEALIQRANISLHADKRKKELLPPQ